MRCPACRALVDAASGCCATGHQLRNADGVLVLLDRPAAERVARLETAVATWRAEQGRAPLPVDALPLLPDGPAVRGDPEWRMRRGDLALVRRLMADRTAARVLDVGAWNGWLSARLADDGHDVTAVDAFAGAQALGAQAITAHGWLAVQADLDDLDALEDTYDVVVVDRCLQYFPDPAVAVRQARGRLVPTGLLVVTGMAIRRSSAVVAQRVAAEGEAFRQRFGMELFLRPAKGYLDRDDLATLTAEGLEIQTMPGMRRAQLRARLDAQRPTWHYAIARAPWGVPG